MSDLLESLNEAQRRAVTHANGPLLIVAGAGTGKTTVLTRRYVFHLETQKLTTENILALTFTEKAAGEMEDRILQLLPNGSYDFWISTFHGFCQRLLERHALEIGLPTKFRLLTETDAWLLLKRHIDELPLSHYRPLGNPVKFLGELLKHFSRAKDEGITPEQYLDFAQNAILDGDGEFVTGERARLAEIADCYFAYRKILRDEGALDFGDLIIETLRLLRESPHVLRDLRKQFRLIMVDEFQDTNWAQYELIKLLAGTERNITVVGDDDQAIYKFRGASLANILQFRDDYPDATTILLVENYRSHQEILDCAYGFITKNDPNRLEVRFKDTGLSKRLTSAKGSGGKVETVWYRTLEDEADGVASRILELKEADPELTWNDVAILSRSNDGAEPFIYALERRGIPFRFYALRGLYAQPVVLDLISMLSLANGVHESTHAWRAMSSSVFSFPARDMSIFVQYAGRKGMSLWESLRQSRSIPRIDPEASKRAERLVLQIESLAETARREKPLKVLQLALEKTGYLGMLMKLPENEKIESINLLNSFAQRIKRYEQTTHGPTLRGFLDELRTEIESGEEGALNLDPDEGPELVKVLTVHASKGLEFKHVFIVSMVDQRFPTRPRSDSIPLPDGLVAERLPEGNSHLEEERRLFYVAMTRAKNSVTLTGAEQYGGTRKKKRSTFLSEAGCETSDCIAPTDGGVLALTPSEPLLTPMETAEREAFPLKKRFSFTQLAAFRKCPLQYKFAHMYKIPILGSFQKSFGQSIHLAFHSILQLHLERGKAQQGSLFAAVETAPVTAGKGLRVTLEEAMTLFESAWIDEWYETRQLHDRFKQEGREAVKRMYDAWSEYPPNVAFLEQPFEWRIGERSLKGAVDRIDELPGGGYAIYDYKTGEGKTGDDLETGDKEQLWIYQMAMEERGLPIKKLAYIYVRTGQQAEVELVQGEKRDAFRKDIEGRMEQILLSHFMPSPSPFICRYCDFRQICEHRKL